MLLQNIPTEKVFVFDESIYMERLSYLGPI